MVCSEHGGAAERCARGPRCGQGRWSCCCLPRHTALPPPGSCSPSPQPTWGPTAHSAAAFLQIQCVKSWVGKETPVGASLNPKEEGLQGHGGLRELKLAPGSSDVRRKRLKFELCAPVLPAPRAISIPTAGTLQQEVKANKEWIWFVLFSP